MTFNEIYAKISSMVANANLSDYRDSAIIQVILTGEICGSFYAVVSNGKGAVTQGVNPRSDVQATMKGSDLAKILNKQLNPMVALTFGKIKIQGDVSKLMALKNAVLK